MKLERPLLGYKVLQWDFNKEELRMDGWTLPAWNVVEMNCPDHSIPDEDHGCGIELIVDSTLPSIFMKAEPKDGMIDTLGLFQVLGSVLWDESENPFEPHIIMAEKVFLYGVLTTAMFEGGQFWYQIPYEKYRPVHFESADRLNLWVTQRLREVGLWESTDIE